MYLPATTLCFFLLSLTLFSTSPAVGDDSPTAYEVLQEYNFPMGLLPKGVTKYDLDRSNGKFKVYLNGSCEFWIDDYKLKYKSTITGVISKNELKNLKGISVKVLLVWLNIGEVSRDGGDLGFSVGILSADFEIDSFVESPQCGCGFDCNNAAAVAVAVAVAVGDERKEKDGEWYLNSFLFAY